MSAIRRFCALVEASRVQSLVQLARRPSPERDDRAKEKAETPGRR